MGVGYIVNCAGAGEQTPLLCATFLRKRSFVTTGAGPPKEDSIYLRKHGVFIAGADKIAAMVGDTSFTIKPRLGEYLLLHKDQGSPK